MHPLLLPSRFRTLAHPLPSSQGLLSGDSSLSSPRSPHVNLERVVKIPKVGQLDGGVEKGAERRLRSRVSRLSPDCLWSPPSSLGPVAVCSEMAEGMGTMLL